MINVKIVVGVFFNVSDIKDVITYQLPCIPNIGDIILPNDKLEQMISWRKFDWKITNKNTAINHVRKIAYYPDGTPIIMLGGDPNLIETDLYLEQKLIEKTFIKQVPSIGNEIRISIDHKFKYYYVENIAYRNDNTVIMVWLSTIQPSSYVYVSGGSVDVGY